jgi:hypothetical protein
MQSGLSALNSFPERSFGQSTLRIPDINLGSEQMTGYAEVTKNNRRSFAAAQDDSHICGGARVTNNSALT